MSQDHLRKLMEELLQRLADDNVAAMEQGASVVRALNVLMLKVLENAKGNDSFAVLLHLLRDSSTLMVEMPADPVRPKFTELIMKCLWKLAKVGRGGSGGRAAGGAKRVHGLTGGQAFLFFFGWAHGTMQSIHEGVAAGMLDIDVLVSDVNGTFSTPWLPSTHRPADRRGRARMMRHSLPCGDPAARVEDARRAKGAPRRDATPHGQDDPARARDQPWRRDHGPPRADPGRGQEVHCWALERCRRTEAGGPKRADRSGRTQPGVPRVAGA